MISAVLAGFTMSVVCLGFNTNMNLAANNQNGQKLVYNYINHINQWQYTLSHNIHIQLDNKTKTTFTTEVLGTST